MSVPNTHYGPSAIDRIMKEARRLHFVGIGGINLSSLARLTARRGYEVSGSDRTKTALTEAMEAEGIAIAYEHRADLIEGADALIYTVAISEDNPEYAAARERGIPAISRADYMGYLMTAYPKRVGVAGMHGKSSCTSMIAHTMLAAGKDPTVLSGAELAEMGGSYHLGEGPAFVFEACEYMDSFLDFNPTVAVVLNIEMDHVDYFHSMEQIRSSFAAFAARTGRYGFGLFNADDPQVTEAMVAYEGNKITFGIGNDEADFSARGLGETGGCCFFDIYHQGSFFCHIQLAVTGRYHVYNALAAAASCYLCGMNALDIADGLSTFAGAARRMEYKGRLQGARVYDDYGHHPTEIAATLEGARGLCPDGGRLICVYQPHTYSRTQALFDGFAEALRWADRVILLDIYAAREVNEWGIGSGDLAEAIGERATLGGSFADTARQLTDTAREGDVILLMGAGDIGRIYEYLTVDDDRERGC